MWLGNLRHRKSDKPFRRHGYGWKQGPGSKRAPVLSPASSPSPDTSPRPAGSPRANLARAVEASGFRIATSRRYARRPAGGVSRSTG